MDKWLLASLSLFYILKVIRTLRATEVKLSAEVNLLKTEYRQSVHNENDMFHYKCVSTTDKNATANVAECIVV